MAWNIPLVSQGQGPGSVAPQFLVYPQSPPWWGVVRCLDAEQTLLSKNENISVLSALFSAQIQTSPIADTVSKVSTTPANTSTGMFLFISLLFYGDKWMLKVLAILLFAFRQGCPSKTMH